MSDEILTIREVAEYLKVTEKTVYGLAQKRQIPAFKVGGQWRVRREDIDFWIGAKTADTVGGQDTVDAEASEQPTGRRGSGRKNS